MKKFFLALSLSFFLTTIFAQDTLIAPVNTPSSPAAKTLARANDHLMIQLGYAGWSGTPDSINTKGLSRSFNIYLMYDFLFKTNPKLSIAVGAGGGTDNIYFDKTYVGIKDATPTLRFQDLSDTNSFKKYKLVTAYLEAPIEFRFSSNPDNPNKSYKFAIGAKVGTLVGAHTKGKTLRDKDDKVLSDHKEKYHSKAFFNSTRLVATVRFGWGPFGIYGTYQFNSLFKTGAGPDVKPYSIGILISGL